jgi:5-methylcytosine-specific restriction endonuclease McrA
MRRKIVLHRDRMCRACRLVRSTEVDHIERGDDHSLANLQGLCGPCHRAKTAQEGVRARH